MESNSCFAILMKVRRQNCGNCDNAPQPSPNISFDGTIRCPKNSLVCTGAERFGITHIANSHRITGQKILWIGNHHLFINPLGIISDYTAGQVKMFIYELLQQEYYDAQVMINMGILHLSSKVKMCRLAMKSVPLTVPPTVKRYSHKP